MQDKRHNNFSRILTTLNQLDSDWLESTRVRLGGGTLISHMHGLFRVCDDINLFCEMGEPYRRLRRIVLEANYHPSVLFKTTVDLTLKSNFLVYPYRITFPLMAGETQLNFSIFAEPRFQLDAPVNVDAFPVPCLSRDDCVAEKLLANADRSHFAGSNFRDLIDLAILRTMGPFSREAIAKAENAYDVLEPLRMSLNDFMRDETRRKQTLKNLGIKDEHWVQAKVEKLYDDIQNDE